MTPQKATSAAQLFLTGLACACIAGLIQAHWLNGPLERDQSIYFLIGHLLSKGRSLYSDLWDHKPPAIHISYMLAEYLVGYSMRAVWLLGTVLSTCSSLGLYVLLRRFLVPLPGLILALSIFLLLNQSPNLEASQPNSEAFINCLWIWSSVLLLKKQTSLKEETIAALLCGLATLFKPFAIIFFVPLFIANLLLRKAVLIEIFRCTVLVCFSPILLWGLTYSYFSITQGATYFYEALYTYNRYYAGSLWENLAYIFSPAHLLPPALSSLRAPLLLSFLFILQAFFKSERATAGILLLTILVTVYVGIALPGNYYLHYYQYLLPPLALASGLSVANLAKPLSYFLVSLVLVFIVLHEAPLITSPETNHRAPTFPISGNMQARKLVPAIFKYLPAGSWFYVWGAQAGLYFDTKVDPINGAFHVHWLMEGPSAMRLTDQTLSSLQSNPPAIVVVARKFATELALGNPVYRWIVENYAPIPNYIQSGEFVLLNRK